MHLTPPPIPGLPLPLRGGCGRAGTVGSALLAASYALHVDEALERVQRGFYTRGGGGQKRCPETDEQFGFVRRFVRDVTSTG